MANAENLHSLSEANKAMGQGFRPMGISIVSILMILFGFAEIATGFTHNFLGVVSTAQATASTFGGVGVGTLYAVGGFFLLAMKKWTAAVSEICLVLVIIGRISLVVFGLYPLNSFPKTFSIIVGTIIAIIFAIYIWYKRKLFR